LHPNLGGQMNTSANKLLSLLPAQEFEDLAKVMEVIELKPRRVLHHARSALDDVYFIEQGLVSVQADVGFKKLIEVWLIGCEGMVGAPAIAGETFSTHKRLVYVAGSARRITIAALQAAMSRNPTLRDMLNAYLVDLLFQTSQSGACNAVHALPRRTARWLLLACATSDSELPMTHDALARVLGVRRATISECLQSFQRNGLIETSRGRIRLCDEAALEAVACPCYRLIRRHRERFHRRFECATALADTVR
jgi:CRP-like cAMP-binding protein